ncbi:histidine-rich protein-like [Drosophila elegans]|nr:histidine-rich protein-like [Drosophila elegans]
MYKANPLKHRHHHHHHYHHQHQHEHMNISNAFHQQISQVYV